MPCSACADANLWWSWALRDLKDPPFALWEPVWRHLRKPTYVPSETEIEVARQYLQRQGKAGSVDQLSRLMGTQSKALPSQRQNRSRLFKNGELAPLIIDALRQSEGMMSVAAIAASIAAAAILDGANSGLDDLLERRVGWSLTRLRRSGVVIIVGRQSRTVFWRLAHDREQAVVSHALPDR
jgi:hypothetical protein